MSILASIVTIGTAASTTNWSLCHIFRKGTSLGNNDAWWQWRQNRRNRTRRRMFLHNGTSCIDRSCRSPSSYARHGAQLPAPKHTTIRKHTMQQAYVFKTRFLLLLTFIRPFRSRHIDESLFPMVAGCNGCTMDREHWQQQQRHIYVKYVPSHGPCAWIAVPTMFRNVVIRLKVRPK
jgi:hypothetical protein